MPPLLPKPKSVLIPRWLWLLAIGSFLSGIAWRIFHIFYFHPPAQNIYSDMRSYVSAASRLFDPNIILSIDDTIFPPGMAYSLGILRHIDPSLALATTMQFFLSTALSLVIAAIAWRLYDRRVGLIALIMASFYFPFIDYAAYFLSEMPHLFFLNASVLFLILTLQVKRTGVFAGLTFLTGLTLASAAAFKSVVLLPAFLVVLFLIFWAWRKRWSRLPALLGLGLFGMSLVFVPTAIRCTQLSDGKFCLISNNGGLNVLLGHYGELKRGNFHDAARNVNYHFALPASIQRGYVATADFDFGPYDGAKARDEAWRWMSRHPIQALELSAKHVLDLFIWPPWPSSHQSHKFLAASFMGIYAVLILLPAVFLLFQRRRKLWRVDADIIPEILLFLPLIGLVIVAFCTAGEPRLRVSYDGLILIVAAKFYSQKIKRAEVS